jgi:hypothetical protein
MFSFIELAILRQKEEPKFWEYILHHFMAAALIFYSLLFNIIQVGMVVKLVHDIGI